MFRAIFRVLPILLGSRSTSAQQPVSPDTALWRQVEIIRTAHGVPHVRAQTLTAAGYALAWLQLEDYGPRTAINLVRARAAMGQVFGRDSMASDYLFQPARARAIETWHLLEPATREFYSGFAAGVNRYIELHPEEFPPGMPLPFTGYDVATLDIGQPAYRAAQVFLERLSQRPLPRDTAGSEDDIGSNAWALAPSRTTSGHAILLRNPHLAWTAGYYEAHITVPGVLDFYGDFRIGSPFGVVGGFNRELGWATTNNSQDLEAVYSLDGDPSWTDHYLLDGTSIPLERRLVSVEFRNGFAYNSETHEQWLTSLGPVIARTNGKIYIVKTAGEGEFRAGEQFLRMMRARSFAEWQDAMRLRARVTSNFTYADRAGNIYFVWNAALPRLPHAPGGDTIAILVTRTEQVWTEYIPFDSLPQFRNPRGGYVHNENSSPHFTNVREPVDTSNRYPNFEPPSLSLRSQLSLQLIGGEDKLSLEDVIRLKHSYRMLLADRVKPDLLRAVRSGDVSGQVGEAAALLAQWDNTSSPESRGSTLFEVWWSRYSLGLADSLRYARRWSAADPLETPMGLSDLTRAREAFIWAVSETARRFGRWDVAWGEVHRVRRGTVDEPVGGCSGALGCFRVLTFARESDGKLAANGSDGWILAVEFGPTPRAFSVLAYGESPRPESPWFADQAGMFARGELKRVVFEPHEVDSQAVLRYHPGAPK